MFALIFIHNWRGLIVGFVDGNGAENVYIYVLLNLTYKRIRLQNMLHIDTLEFLKSLKANNNREWFAENREWYECSRADVECLVGEIITELVAFEEDLTSVEAKKCMFRIYRDIRFSLDKTPYKTHFSATFRRRRQEKTSGYYLHIEPGGSFLSCGQYMLDSNNLKKVRREIYEDFDFFKSILDEKGLKREFGDLYRGDDDILKRVPNGFDGNHPAAEYLKLRHFYVLKEIGDKKILKPGFAAYAGKMFQMVKPLNDFLHDVLTE